MADSGGEAGVGRPRIASAPVPTHQRPVHRNHGQHLPTEHILSRWGSISIQKELFFLIKKFTNFKKKSWKINKNWNNWNNFSEKN